MVAYYTSIGIITVIGSGRMLYYEGLTCPVCGRLFLAGDDIVVCPECGLPHHRECWLTENRCAMADAHGTDHQWTRPTTPPVAPTAPPQYAPPVQEYTPAYAPNPIAENHPQEQHIDGVALSDLTAVVGSNTRYYLPRFFRLAEYRSGGWNWAAFLLGHWWLIYRKQYKLGIFLFAIQTVLDLLAVYMTKDISSNASIAEMMEILMQQPMLGLWMFAYYAYLFSHIWLGIKGNQIYLKGCKNKIRRLRAKTPDLSAVELAASGGTALGIVALFYLLSYLISLASTYLFM